MKVILLSDLHIVPDGKDSWGINPLLRLRAAVDGIIAYHADAEICVILGDIANKGETAAYQLAAKELARLPMPFYLLAGNHDSAKTCAAFLESSRKVLCSRLFVHQTVILSS